MSVHASLRKIVQKFHSGVPATVVALGDSITAGSQVDPARDESIVYHRQWHQRLMQRYPKLNLTIANRGVPGHKIADAHGRLQREVIEARPDLVIVAFGINDCWDGPDRADEFERELERLAARIREGCDTAIVLMTTNMMNFRSSEAALKMAWFAEKTAHVQNAGWTDEFMNRVRSVARRTDVPLADGYAKWEAARQRGVDTDALLTNLANHPNRDGHKLLADALDELFSD